LNPEALNILSSIEGEIAVASFCGRQGYGKSTLLNFCVGSAATNGSGVSNPRFQFLVQNWP